MAQLAIKGHATRGKEVIEILEMLGGEDEYKFRGNNEECAYFEKNGVIYNTSPIGFNNIKLFTLEEFLEKYPYKVGDKVLPICFSHPTPQIIKKMRWDGSEICYYTDSKSDEFISNDLQPLKNKKL